MASALAVYANLLASDDGTTEAGHVLARLDDGTVRPVGIRRWLAAADQTDLTVLSAIDGPVLDVGCGPGRHLHALAQRGVFGLGVDICPAAIALARRRGAAAILASIFDELPGAGCWRSALLLDGNVGIGGAPVRLLRRIAALLGPGGRVLVEVAAPGSASRGMLMRLEAGERTSDWFPWADVAAEQLGSVALPAGYSVERVWEQGGRWFGLLAATGRGWATDACDGKI